MDAFEYALGFFSLLIGLAITHMAASLHKLLRNADVVRWDPLAILSALYSALLAITLWFDLWRIRDVEATRTLFFYLTLVFEFLIVYLIAASSLPDEADEKDLAAFYARDRRYHWILVLVFQLSYSAHWLYFKYLNDFRGAWEGLYTVVLSLAIPCLLIASRSRKVHYAGVIMMLLLIVDDYSAAAIKL